MFCLLVVLAKLLLLAKWLARKTPLMKPNCGEGSISIKPRPKSVHNFLGLLYCFIVLLCICVVSCPYVIYYPTVMARYSLFVLKVPLNPKQTNKQFQKLDLSFCIRAAFMRKFCVDNNWLEPSERAINQTFSHQVNYARRRLKVTGNHHSYLSPAKPKKLCSGLHQMSPPDHAEKDCYKTEPYSQGLV